MYATVKAAILCVLLASLAAIPGAIAAAANVIDGLHPWND
jgi:hypothetical protein